MRALPIDIVNWIEETMEMFGVSMFLDSLADHLEREFAGVRILFATPTSDSDP